MNIEETIRRIVREEIAKTDVCDARLDESVCRVLSRATFSATILSRATFSATIMLNVKPPAPQASGKRKRKRGPAGGALAVMTRLYEKMKPGDEFTLKAEEIAKSLGIKCKAAAGALRYAMRAAAYRPAGLAVSATPRRSGNSCKWTVKRTK